MTDPFQQARRKAREEYARETAGEATAAEREEDLRRLVREPFLEQFDRDFAAEFGRYPKESPPYGTTPQRDDSRRREAIQALIDRGATAGEREAATAALYRLDHPSEQAHTATERGSYYARDTLAHSGGGDE